MANQDQNLLTSIPTKELKDLLARPSPILALAPMQDVTDLPFMRLMARYGGPDLFYTEYFRVHATSNLEKPILRSITENDTGKPVIAQMIGNDIPALVRTARELQEHPVAAIDLNLGCPAPVVYRKCAGGGLLREPKRVYAILGALREALEIPFTVKTRLGFDDPRVFDELLPIFARHNIDLLTIHARTVAEMYRSEVHYEYIVRAASELTCPILANGNIYSAEKADEVLRVTSARGLMIGRGAIRNPWLFHQFRQFKRGEPLFVPRGCDVLNYLRDLYETTKPATDFRETAQVQKMKKYTNFIGVGVDAEGRFLHEIRRVTTEREFFAVCEKFMNHSDPMPLAPFALQLAERDVMAGEHR